MAAMLMSEMLMELLCFRRQKFDYDDAWRRTFLPTRPLKSAFSMRAASYEPRGDDFAFTDEAPKSKPIPVKKVASR